MRHTMVIAAALLALSIGSAHAQAASAPAAGPGMGMGGMHGWRMNRGNTPGWPMMTGAERQAHHDKMMAMTDHGACMTYMKEHHARMSERAKERGRTLPGKPRQDACAPLANKK